MIDEEKMTATIFELAVLLQTNLRSFLQALAPIEMTSAAEIYSLSAEERQRQLARQDVAVAVLEKFKPHSLLLGYLDTAIRGFKGSVGKKGSKRTPSVKPRNFTLERMEKLYRAVDNWLNTSMFMTFAETEQANNAVGGLGYTSFSEYNKALTVTARELRYHLGLMIDEYRALKAS